MNGVLGVDPSLTGTGYAWRYPRGALEVGSIIQKEGRGMHRLITIASIMEDQLMFSKAKLMAIEGYAFGFGPAASRAHSLGEIGGIIKYLAFTRRVNILVVPPNSLKLFMLGRYKTVKGGKKVKTKLLVKAAAEKHAGRAFASTDQSDAYSLLLMGEAYSDRRRLPRIRSHYQHAAIGGCEFLNAERGR